jgi:ATP-binding cassette, subfamily B, bacterial
VTSLPQREQKRQPSSSLIAANDKVTLVPREASATAHELSRIGLFAELPGERLAELASRMTREYVPAGQEIVREGEFGGRFYVVLEGMLTVTQEARGERRVLRPGDYFGEVAPAMGIRRTATVRAVTPATVASCERVTFDEFVRPLFID